MIIIWLRSVEIRHSYDSTESEEETGRDTTAQTKLIQDKSPKSPNR